MLPRVQPAAAAQPTASVTATVRPGRGMRAVIWPDGRAVTVPEGWELLPPGDAGVTRRVKAAGPHWVVQEQVGRRVMSRGVWAPRAAIEAATRSMARDRSDPAWQAGLARGRARRSAEQEAYVLEFTRHVLAFLAFPERHAALARTLATRVAEHATPVGSGTVARTSRIPVAERAEAALIAWLRHQTTAYDDMHIARVKGARREVRRGLARDSRRLLERYRSGLDPAADCPLAEALAAPVSEVAPPPPRPAPPQSRVPASPTTAQDRVPAGPTTPPQNRVPAGPTPLPQDRVPGGPTTAQDQVPAGPTPAQDRVPGGPTTARSSSPAANRPAAPSGQPSPAAPGPEVDARLARQLAVRARLTRR